MRMGMCVYARFCVECRERENESVCECAREGYRCECVCVCASEGERCECVQNSERERYCLRVFVCVTEGER